MTPSDIFYYTFSIGFIILVGFMAYAFYQASITLQSLESLIKKIDDIVVDVQSTKNIMKYTVAHSAGSVLNILTTILKKL